MSQMQTLYDIRAARLAGVIPPTPQSPLGVGEIMRVNTRQFVLRLTPSEAAFLLTKLHPRQRKIDDVRVGQYLRSMQTDDWHEPPFTFDSIAFDTQGRLCNGAHRLTALSKHDKPLSFYVIYGVQSPSDLPLPEGDGNKVRGKAFIAGVERDDWAVISYLAKCVFGSESPARTDIQSLHPIFLDALNEIRRTNRSPAAPCRAAFVFAFSSFDYGARQPVAEQWRAYCRVDVTTMWPSIARLYRKMNGTQNVGKGSVAQRFLFESTLYAIHNPQAIRILRQENAASLVRKWVAGNFSKGQP